MVRVPILVATAGRQVEPPHALGGELASQEQDVEAARRMSSESWRVGREVQQDIVAVLHVEMGGCDRRTDAEDRHAEQAPPHHLDDEVAA